MIGDNHRRALSVRVAAGLFLIAVLLGPAAAVRAEVDNQTRAQQLFSEGNTLYEKQDYAGAVERFERALKLLPSPQIELNIGLAREKMGDLAAAATHLERFLEQISAKTYPQKVKVVRAKLKKLQAKLASVTIAYEEPGAEVSVDGAVIGKTPLRRRIYRVPGALRLSVAKPGFVTFSSEQKLGQGEHRRIVVQLPPQPVAPAAADTKPALNLSASTTPADSGDQAKPIYKKWWFWSIIGAAVVGGTVGAVVATQTGGSDRVPSGELGTIP